MLSCLMLLISVAWSLMPVEYSKSELLGKINPSQNANFVKIDPQYTSKTNIYLRKETYIAYKSMHEAAKLEGVELRIVSAFRSFDKQKSIWNSKWTGQRKVEGKDLSKNIPDKYQRAKKILEYSSMPGSSRHHWGTDIDIYSLENTDFEKSNGLIIYQWLQLHASEFGFCQTYNEGRKKGYEEEKWHWSYIPIAKQMLIEYQNKIHYSDFNGFQGCETADSLNIINNFVFGINSDCVK